MKRVVFVASVVALLLAPRAASAYRPFDGTDASVADLGELELEVGPVGYVRQNHRGATAPVQVLNLGILERTELVLQTRPVSPPDKAHADLALADNEALLKCVLLEGSLHGRRGLVPSIAAEAGALLPTWNDEPGAGASLSVIISERVGAGAVHLNLEGARLRDGRANAFVGAIFEGPAQWSVRPVAELIFDRELGEHTTTSALLGFIAPISDAFSLDYGTRLARFDGDPVFEVRAGFTWALPIWR